MRLSFNITYRTRFCYRDTSDHQISRVYQNWDLPGAMSRATFWPTPCQSLKSAGGRENIVNDLFLSHTMRIFLLYFNAYIVYKGITYQLFFADAGHERGEDLFSSRHPETNSTMHFQSYNSATLQLIPGWIKTSDICKQMSLFFIIFVT